MPHKSRLASLLANLFYSARGEALEGAQLHSSASPTAGRLVASLALLAKWPQCIKGSSMTSVVQHWVPVGKGQELPLPSGLLVLNRSHRIGDDSGKLHVLDRV